MKCSALHVVLRNQNKTEPKLETFSSGAHWSIMIGLDFRKQNYSGEVTF